MTSGCGRLIQGVFDGVCEWQKMQTAEIMKRAAEKIQMSHATCFATPNPAILISVIEEGSRTTDSDMAERWANLLASEFIHGGVHPEIPRILARLTKAEAQMLSVIAAAPADGNAQFRSDSVQHDILAAYRLIDAKDNEGWKLTNLGHAFVAAVTMHADTKHDLMFPVGGVRLSGRGGGGI